MFELNDVWASFYDVDYCSFSGHKNSPHTTKHFDNMDDFLKYVECECGKDTYIRYEIGLTSFYNEIWK